MEVDKKYELVEVGFAQPVEGQQPGWFWVNGQVFYARKETFEHYREGTPATLLSFSTDAFVGYEHQGERRFVRWHEFATFFRWRRKVQP